MFHVICGKACAWMFLRAIFGSFAVVHVHFFLFCFIFPHSLPFSLSLTVCFVSQFLFLFAKRCVCCCCCFHRRLGLMWFALLFILHFFYRNTIIRFFPLEWAEWILCYLVSLVRKRARESCLQNATYQQFFCAVSQSVRRNVVNVLSKSMCFIQDVRSLVAVTIFSFVLSFKMHFRTWDFIAFNMTFARLCSIHFTRSLSLLFSIKTAVLPFISRSRSELSIFHIFKKHFIMLEVEPLLLSFSTKTLKLFKFHSPIEQYGQSFSHFFFSCSHRRLHLILL